MCRIDSEIRLIYIGIMLTKQDLKSIALLLRIQKEEILDEVDIRMDKKLEEKLTEQTKEILQGIAAYI